MFIRMTCPYGHSCLDGEYDCRWVCYNCQQPMCHTSSPSTAHFYADNENYCSYCMSTVIYENSKTMTLEDMCDRWSWERDYIYDWIYGDGVDNAVTTIGNWWFIQRKKK